MHKKVFIIGFNKTGTSSLHRFFSHNGYKSAHWKKGDLAITIRKNISQFRNPLSNYPRHHVYSDMECVDHPEYPLIEAYKDFPSLFKWYPNAYFILNTRNVDNWLESRAKHGNGIYLDWYKYHYGIQSKDEIIRLWRMDYYHHHYRVLDFFNNKPNSLLVFDIDNHSPEKISSFLDEDFSLDLSLYKIHNKTRKEG